MLECQKSGECRMQLDVRFQVANIYIFYRILGADHHVEPLRKNLLRNADLFDPSIPLADNLESILEIRLPAKPEDDDEREDYNVDCCVCYSLVRPAEEGQDGSDALPEMQCPNEKCGKRYHEQCLFDYLQSNPENRITGTEIHGLCCYCEQPMSCTKIR